MNKSFVLALVSLSFLLNPGSLFAQVAERAPNVQINVEFQSAGYAKNFGGLAPPQVVHQSVQNQFLLVQSGMEGSLFIGKHVPYVSWYRTYLEREGYLTDVNIQFRSVGTSLRVSPRVVGSRIEITLTPEISYETGDGRGTIAVTQMSTTVSAMNGETIEIGSVKSSEEFDSYFYQRETGEVVSIRLTPQIR